MIKKCITVLIAVQIKAKWENNKIYIIKYIGEKYMSLLKRRDGEDDFEYELRLSLLKLKKEIDIGWDVVVDLAELEVSPDHQRKVSYGYEKYDTHMKTKGYNGEGLVELEEKMKEFEKEKIKYQDQKREYRTLLREDARWEHLKDTLTNEVRKVNLVNPMNNELTGLTKVNQFDREAILVLSDWHIGMEIDSHWNIFNIQVAKERMKKLATETIQYCHEQKVEKLHVLICGDMIHGLIHTNARIQSSEDSIQQTIIVSEMLSDMMCLLSNEISNICVYDTHGNHGRAVADKKQALESENFEKIITWYMQARLVNCSNVKFIDSLIDNEIIELDVFNNKIYAVHGHNDNIGGVIENLSQMTRTFPDMIITGHWHKDFQTEKFNTTLMVNGGFCGLDHYARSKRLNNVPHQKLIIFDEYVGELCTYKIRLK